jgi:TolB-like protein
VFISHSSKDEAIAEAICQHLGSAGVQCWIAPRDIEPETDWTEGIMRGITNSRIFVLVFSGHANDSDHVRREVGEAFSLHLPVIPFRTETVEPRAGLRYFLESVHWLDATKPPLEQHLPLLTERVKALLNHEQGISPHETARANEPKPIPNAAPRRKRWLPVIALIGAAAVVAAGIWFFVANSHKTNESNPIPASAAIPAKSIAVLPFESLSDSKSDTYFADGVQDEILNNLAKIAQLKVISRTSVMQYRGDNKGDLRQIAAALGVATVLEGAVRRDGNRVRVSTELIDARNDTTIWADTYDRDLTDIFAIQSEVSQTIARKLTAALSIEQKKLIEVKPTDNFEAYDLYLQAKELIATSDLTPEPTENFQKPLLDSINLLGHAVELDPKFALAYCTAARANAELYGGYDMSPARRTLGDGAVANALRLQPGLPEAHLAYARQLYVGYRDYERARVQLAIAERGLPNNSEALALEAYIDRRQGDFEKAIQGLYAAIALDPRNPMTELANTLYMNRQFSAAGRQFDRAIELAPDQPMLKVLKAFLVTFMETGNSTPLQSALPRCQIHWQSNGTCSPGALLSHCMSVIGCK